MQATIGDIGSMSGILNVLSAFAQATSPPSSETESWEVTTIADRAAAALTENVWVSIAYMALGIVAVIAFLAISGLVLIWMERKVAGHFQCRIGPKRVGPLGMLQTMMDALKLFLKEDIVPERADRLLHAVAPAVVLLATILLIAIIPFGPALQVIDLNIGIVFVTAVTGFGVLGILIGGWGSFNKWSLLGAMRAGAQIISYELSAILAILVAVLFAGSLQMSEIVQSQADLWLIFRGHVVAVVAFFVFVVASTAELNRTPFDLPEGESEIAAGFHTEYSGLRFAFFFLAEFVNMFIAAAVAATLFLGGWMPFHVGGFEGFNAVMDLIPPVVWFAGKTIFLVFVFMWFRWTFPRLRVDQLMRLEWKFLLPVGFANLFLAAAIVMLELYFYPTP